MVIAVGPLAKRFNGRHMMVLRRGSEDTPLQLKLNDLAKMAHLISPLFIFIPVGYFDTIGGKIGFGSSTFA